jgi:hypothetical protein
MRSDTDARLLDPPVTECTVYWFVVMERARKEYNFERAIHAQRELERLGVRVTYARSRKPRGGRGYVA